MRSWSVVSVRGAGLLLVVASVLAVASSPSQAALPEQRVLVAPGGWVSSYATPAVAVEQGGALTLVNGDLMYHDVVARAEGRDDQAWCTLYLPTRPCPLFWSALVPLGESTSVLGLENLVPGTVYEFYCTAHPGMVGRLVALPGIG